MKKWNDIISYIPKRLVVPFTLWLVFVLGSVALRTVLLGTLNNGTGGGFNDSMYTLLIGFMADLFVAGLLFMPVLIFYLLTPVKLIKSRLFQLLIVGFIFVQLLPIIFDFFAEYLFWAEFGKRFNFIAVDYLIYTTEVITNIFESYNMPIILSLVIGAAFFVSFIANKLITNSSETDLTWRQRVYVFLCWISVIVTSGIIVNNSHDSATFENQYLSEISRNGVQCFIKAFIDNKLDYREFYLTIPADRARTVVRELISKDGSKILNNSNSLSVKRLVKNSNPQTNYNIIQITIESLSLSYTGRKKNSLTPFIDSLVDKSICCSNFYATGTRTVRGMEAYTLSMPPTPGRSILKREGCENMNTLGAILSKRGYDSQFLYGGYGYFDNMNHFFRNNGYDIIDLGSDHKTEPKFTNAWGACDGDLYDWALEAADKSYSDGVPFNQFIMTTSNHRPYTFPAYNGTATEIKHRSGAVKYTDYALRTFFEKAQSKPWFQNTIWVITADHCASSAGKTNIPLKKYQIPLLIYAPKLIKPRKIDTICSQLDLAPTIMDLIGGNYISHFWGRTILSMPKQDGRAFVGTYQKLGYLTIDKLVVLEPGSKVNVYNYDNNEGLFSSYDRSKVERTIAFYQQASDYFEKHQKTVKETAISKELK